MIKHDKLASLKKLEFRRFQYVSGKRRAITHHFRNGISPQAKGAVYAWYTKREATEIIEASTTRPVLLPGVKYLGSENKVDSVYGIYRSLSKDFSVVREHPNTKAFGFGTSPVGMYWWIWKGSFYSASENLTSSDVEALILERDNRQRLRVEKAHALLSMIREIDNKTTRQPIPQEVKVVVWRRDNARCVDCGSQKELEYDHIIPLAMGGSNTARNIQLLCAVCNRRKGATLG